MWLQICTSASDQTSEKLLFRSWYPKLHLYVLSGRGVGGWHRRSICAQNFHPCTIHALATREKKKEHWRSNFVKLSPFPPPPLFLASPLAAPRPAAGTNENVSLFQNSLLHSRKNFTTKKMREGRDEISFVRPRPWKRMPTAGGLYLPCIPRSIFKSVKRPRTLVSQNVAQLVLEATLRFPHVARRRNNYRILGWTSSLARKRERKRAFPTKPHLKIISLSKTYTTTAN